MGVSRLDQRSSITGKLRLIEFETIVSAFFGRFACQFSAVCRFRTGPRAQVGPKSNRGPELRVRWESVAAGVPLA